MNIFDLSLDEKNISYNYIGNYFSFVIKIYSCSYFFFLIKEKRKNDHIYSVQSIEDFYELIVSFVLC